MFKGTDGHHQLPKEPFDKRAIAYFDGQSMFHAARLAFGCVYPNYDVQTLAMSICTQEGWRLVETRFYTGIPNAQLDPSQHAFWSAKLASMGAQGVKIVTRPLRYRRQWVRRPDGSSRKFRVREEKGIDVKIALDVVHGAHERRYDVAVIFGRDQVLTEAIELIQAIAREQNRWIKIASAFPDSKALTVRRGINKTDWIPINAETYAQCLDHRDHRIRESRVLVPGAPGTLSSLILETIATPAMAIGKRKAGGLKLFVSYSHKDEKLRDELRNHLSVLMREGQISEWYDRKISLGRDVDLEISKQINKAHIVLLLVSSDFLASNYCYDVEVRRAMERHESGECRVVPVILRHCDWKSALFGKLLSAPKDGIPITDRSVWRDNDAALFDVATRIRSLAKEVLNAGK